MAEVPYLTGEDFLKGAKPSPELEGIFEKLDRENDVLIDSNRLRLLQDWSYLSGQIVGAEVDYRP